MILANPQGCALPFGQLLALGMTVRLERLPAGGSVTARVANCTSMGSPKSLAPRIRLDEVGNGLGHPGARAKRRSWECDLHESFPNIDFRS
jgi:hypothetical protein